MPLSRLEVEGYRAFADPTVLEIRPLTLLFGYNSAGKSALIRLLPLLAASAEPGADGVLNLDATANRKATFADLKCRFSAKPIMRFALEWDDDASPVRRVELGILDLVALRRQVVEWLRVTNADGSVLQIQLELPESEESTPLTRYLFEHGRETATADLDFEGIVPSLREGASLPGPTAATLAGLVARLRSLRTSVHWIGSLRVPPPRGRRDTETWRRARKRARGGAARFPARSQMEDQRASLQGGLEVHAETAVLEERLSIVAPEARTQRSSVASIGCWTRK